MYFRIDTSFNSIMKFLHVKRLEQSKKIRENKNKKQALIKQCSLCEYSVEYSYDDDTFFVELII